MTRAWGKGILRYIIGVAPHIYTRLSVQNYIVATWATCVLEIHTVDAKNGIVEAASWKQLQLLIEK